MPAKTEATCDAMVGDDSRVAEVSAAAAALRGEEGSRCRASVLNLRSALGLGLGLGSCACAGAGACAARTLAGAIRSGCAAIVRVLGAGRGNRELAAGNGVRVCVCAIRDKIRVRPPGRYKTAGAAGQ